MAATATGRQPCRFYRQGNDWFCSTGLPSDIVIEVEGLMFHIHKFPLLSKCGKIVHLFEEHQNTSEDKYHKLVAFPGGPDAFLLAVKFCYGIRVELSSKNIIMVYCAAEYLEMTEEYDEENLLFKVDDFFHKVVLRSWKDCILALQSSEHSIPKSETLHIVSKCLNSLSMMVCTDLSLFGWPLMMYGKLQSPGGSILWNGINTGARIRSSQSDWWFEDVSCLGIPMFTKLIETMKERGIRPENIAGALMYYSRKYLPGLGRWQSAQGSRTRTLTSLATTPAAVDQKNLLEAIEVLLPEKKGKSYCRFLLGLLRMAIILNVCQSCKNSLERRIGVQLEYATLDGLLVPSFSDSDNLYDIDCVERIIQHFLASQGTNIPSFSPSTSGPITSPSSGALNRVTKLIDGYLAEVAPDVNLKPEKMRYLMEVLPESLRSLDDGLYRALDIYLKAHPWLPDNEKEKLCSIVDWGKLSIDGCAHAAQNERLPLRVVLQVLFVEQLHLRRTLSHCLHLVGNDNNVTAPTNNPAGQSVHGGGWVSLVRENNFLKEDLDRMMSRVRELEQEFSTIKQEMATSTTSHGLIASTPTLSRKLWCMPVRQVNNRHPDVIESTSPSPRKSADLPRPSRGV